jgi:small multidrug resistance pump/quaternary ammonium compound-resistance protein SugE
VALFLSLLAAGAYTVGGLFMRKAEGFAHAVPAAMVFGCFCAGAALQTLAMRRSELSVNYILVLGLEAAFALVLGVAWLGEGLTARKLAGVALVLAGIVSLRLGERHAAAASSGGAAHGAPSASTAAPDPAALDAAAPLGGRRALSLAERRRRCQNTNHAPCP